MTPSVLSRFRRDKRGNVAMLFGFAFLPAMLFIGFALDYSRALGNQVRLQAAADATALALVHLPANSNAATVQSKANTLIAAYYGATNGETPAATVTLGSCSGGCESNGSSYAGAITVAATSNVPTTIMQITGVQTIAIKANSQAIFAKNKLEIALVLDNSGSMAQAGKMAALKSAVNDFITQIQALPQGASSVKMSIAPFTTQVNLGTALSGNSSSLRYDVTLENPTLTQYANAGYTYNFNGQTKPFGSPNPPTPQTWQGCVSDRDHDYDEQSVGVSGNSTKYVAANCFMAPLTAALPLTADLESIRSQVTAMVSNGGTNLTVGFTAGLATLRNDTPLGAASSTASDVQKFLVFLTDGNNTMNRFGGDGSDGNSYASQIDARTLQACSQAKQGATAGVTIFTIRVIEGNATLLQGCASTPGNYYSATSAAEIAPVFKSILDKITNIHLTQ